VKNERLELLTDNPFYTKWFCLARITALPAIVGA
jgi:hypothetical protein